MSKRQILSGAVVSPTATVKLNINGKLKETSCTVVGPVDAAINAIRELIQYTMDIELEEYNLEAITGGTDALAEVFVISSDGEGNKSVSYTHLLKLRILQRFIKISLLLIL